MTSQNLSAVAVAWRRLPRGERTHRAGARLDKRKLRQSKFFAFLNAPHKFRGHSDFIMEPYAARSFRFIELMTLDGWRMKLYGIAWRGELPQSQLIEAAKRIAADVLLKESAGNYKVGFIGVHEGRGASFVFVDFWGNENELFHRVFLSRGNDVAALTPATAADSSVCVWDLRLQNFEREAWIKHVLSKPDAPDFDGYLTERLNELA